MGCIQRIKSFPSYTKTEAKISNFILDNLESALYDTAQILADKTDTSAAAVIRFSKNLGYGGFTDFKLALATDLKNDSTDNDFSERIENHDSLDTVIKKAKISDTNVIEQTYGLLNQNDLDTAIELIRNAKTIYLIGIGSSGICCMDFHQKLSRIHRHVIYQTDFHVLITSLAYMSEDDVVLGISYSGETNEVTSAMRYAKECGAKTIAITQRAKNTVNKLADLSLHVPTTEKDLRLGAVTSRNASLILTDLLYIGLIRNGLDNYKERLRHTREAVKRITKGL